MIYLVMISFVILLNVEEINSLQSQNHYLNLQLAKEVLVISNMKRNSYQKPDGTKGSKWELVEKMSTLSEVSRLLADKMFGKNRHETYLQHVFRKVLGSRGRANLRKNIGDSDVIVYSDFSKGTLFFMFTI